MGSIRIAKDLAEISTREIMGDVVVLASNFSNTDLFKE